MHPLEILIVAVIALAILGPKSLQTLARGAGKTMGQAKEAKDKVLSELSIDEVKQAMNVVPKIPLNSRQAVQMLLAPDEKSQTVEKSASEIARPIED